MSDDLRDAYERLCVAYTHYVDFGEAARIADLFTDDGVWESAEAKMDGREQIRRSFTARQQRSDRVSRHVCTNIAVEPDDAGHARGLCYFTLYRYDGDRRPAPLDGPQIVGQYRDTLALTPDGWRLRHRVAEAAFVKRAS